ncbi:MucBP domain-containing protein [Vagococcus carniphilus]|uniref:MucBP domain-containing protein n=1 Tax=Vagococcus carniphilus TaxID=218144 RepID=UPI00288C68C0|nr:MucBP domain-containing protein [Vagococcus carniphilus]MDT2831911.1 MucBP domain-containing protein [Vagococcus carniphilus]MDT2839281.1 MucBP domain-containing protein [Vagococcus carniphilus]MDT2855421.1 MucBP domain-containing protein [Vagococcus carniphilus]
MKIKLKLFLVLLMSFLGGAVSAEAASTEKEFTVNQWATNLYYTESGVLAGMHRSSFPPEEFLITKETPTWGSLTDEELRDKPLDWILKSSNYTYWGYSILYQDQTTEFFNETSFTYDSLSSLELERGKEIRRVDVMYGDTSSITINYNLIKLDGSKELLKSDYSYGLFSANLPSKIELTGQSANLDPMVENYIIVSQDEEAPFYYEENKDKVINIDLRNPQYTIHFTDEVGNKIRESEKIYAEVGNAFNYVAPVIEGYLVRDNESINDVYSKEDKEFTIVYRKKEKPVEKGKVIVNYEDESGKTLSESVILTGKLGEDYKSESKEIAGYKLIDIKGTEEGIFSQAEAVVTYVYQKEAPLIETGKITVNYEDESGKTLRESTILTGKLGEVYKSESKEIAGYKLIDIRGTEEGIFSQAESVITYVYQKEESSTETGKVTVNYEDETGKRISESVILTGKLGEDYKSESKEIAGYKLIDTNGAAEGIYKKEEQVITYVYKKNKGTVITKEKNKKSELIDEKASKSITTSPELPKTGENNTKNIIFSMVGLIEVGSLIFLIKNRESQRQLQ